MADRRVRVGGTEAVPEGARAPFAALRHRAGRARHRRQRPRSTGQVVPPGSFGRIRRGTHSSTAWHTCHPVAGGTHHLALPSIGAAVHRPRRSLRGPDSPCRTRGGPCYEDVGTQVADAYAEVATVTSRVCLLADPITTTLRWAVPDAPSCRCCSRLSPPYCSPPAPEPNPALPRAARRRPHDRPRRQRHLRLRLPPRPPRRHRVRPPRSPRPSPSGTSTEAGQRWSA